MPAGSSTFAPAFFNAQPSVSTGNALPGDGGWAAWFGIPETPTELKPIELQNRSTWTLPTAYRGKNKYLGTTFMLLALSSNSFLTSVILPLQITDQLKFQWTKYEFPAVLPDTVPDLGVVREVKNNFVSQAVSMTRYGLGLQMQHGFMTEEEGRMCYVYHIRQIHQAMMEHLQFECLYELLNNGNWAINTQAKISSWDAPTAESALSRALINECDTWAITQIKDRGDVQMDVHVESVHKMSTNINLDTYIMDSRIRTYLRTIAPQSVPEVFSNDKMKFSVGDNYVDSRGNNVFQTRTLLIDGQIFNPLERVAQIGEFVVSKDSETNISSYRKYTSEDRTISIYSDTDDAWKPITLDQCHNNSYRFHPASGHLRTFSEKHAIEDKGAREDDHLFHVVNGELKPISFFGQMKPEHYTTDDYERMAESAISSVARTDKSLRKNIASSLAYITRILTTMHNVPYNDDYNLWLRALAVKNRGTRVNVSDNARSRSAVEIASNGHNSLNIPTTADEYADAFMKPFETIKGSMSLPPTHGSYGGLRTIADLVSSKQWNANNVPFNIETVADLPQHLAVFEQFVDQLVEIFPNSALVVPRNASEYFLQPKPYDIIFENFFHLTNPSRVLFLRQATASIPGNLRTDVLDAEATYAGDNRQVNLNALRTAQGAQTTYAARGRAQKRWEEYLPEIAQGRQQLMANVLGGIYLGTAEAVDIGSAIGRNDRIVGLAVDVGANDEAWRWDRNNTSASRWGVGGVGTVMPAGGVIDVPAATVGDLDDSLNIYWSLMRLATAPFADTNVGSAAAAYQAMLLTLMASVKTSGSVAEYARALNAVFVDLQRRGHSDLRAGDLGAVPANAAEEIVDIMTNTSRQYIVREIQDKARLKAAFRSYTERANAVSAGPLSPTANVVADQYYRAPIFMGRSAIHTFVATDLAGIKYGVPGSHSSPGMVMSDRERGDAQRYNSNASNFQIGANFTEYGSVGDIFEPASRTTTRMEIKNFPLIKKLLSSYNSSMVAEQRDQRESREKAADNISNNFLRVGKRDKPRRPGVSWEGVSGKSSASGQGMTAMDFYVPEDESAPEQNVGSEELTEAWRANFAALVATRKGIHLLIGLLFMFESVVKSSLDCLIRSNVMFPWNFIIARPHSTWITLTTIKCKPGDQLGNSYLAKLEVESSDDTSVHVYRGNVNYWSGAVVKDEKMCFNIPNSYVSGYIGGHGVGFINPETYEGTFGTPEDSSASIMCFTIPLHEKLNERHISITGKPSWYARDGSVIDLSMVKNSFGYSSSAYYNSHYGFCNTAYNFGISASRGPARYSGRDVTPNSICFASAAIYNSFKTHMPAYVSVQRGHWKNNQIGAGAHNARIGKEPFDYTQQAFHSTFQNIGVC